MSASNITLLLLLACNDYELTPNNDVSSGQACPELTGSPYEVDPHEECVAEPVVGSFDPVIEWQQPENPAFPTYTQIMSTPAIANLTDDNGDGDIDEDDVPDIVYTTFSGSAYSSGGVLNAISGDGGEFHWALDQVDGQGIYSSSSPAIGDLEGDGVPEICVAGTTSAVVCVELVDGEPRLKWAAGSELYAYGAPAIADMNGDGLAEVIFGRQIFDHTGAIVGLGASGVGGNYMSFAADMDGDGSLEVVAGNAAYKRDGTQVWASSSVDGIPAVGDFDGDGLPDVVSTSSGFVRLVNNDGTLTWETALPGGGSGGAPTVADFDGDGAPEVGVAGKAFYSLFDTDGAVIWSNPVSDYSSSITGSSVFDFQGDGASEVVYADEYTLWVFDGATGEVLMQQEGHASGTLFEYPLIADVDNDGSTEIIVASNNYSKAGWTGITVIGDANSSWAPARPIWNQFAYHITNVNNDATIPTSQPPNWESWNNFRAGGTELGPGHWLPDLAPAAPELCTDACSEDLVSILVPVENYGWVDAGEISVSFMVTRSGAPTELTRQTLDVPSGQGAWLIEEQFSRAEWGDAELWVEVDREGEHAECDEDNNRISLGSWPCN
jgi:hypothetical protein